MTILWFMDRFGLPGHYHRTWVRLLRDNHVPTDEVRVVSLHKVLAPRTLLTKIGSRKAPTWVPDEGQLITDSIDQLIKQFKARAVVLTAPESLACLGLAPEHATLHNLRGSVYWRSGVPHLVMLPMSAWFSMVTQKEIGGANYGFESQESFARSRQQGAVREENVARLDADSNVGNESRPDNTGGVRGGQGRTDSRSLEQSGKATGVSDSHTGAAEWPAGGPPRHEGQPATLPHAGTRSPWSGLRSAHSELGGGGDASDSAGRTDFDLPGADDRRIGDTADAGLETPGRDSGVHGDPVGDFEAAGPDEPETDDDVGVDDGDDSLREDDADASGEVSADSDSDSEERADDTDEVDRSEGEMDEFFYEPVLSPVGRFVLTADTQKLFRLLRDGTNAGGPSRPIEVNWR